MSKPKDDPISAVKSILVERKAGYLVLRLKPGEGVMIMDCIEVRLASANCGGKTEEAEIAVRAPKDIRIKRVR